MLTRLGAMHRIVWYRAGGSALLPSQHYAHSRPVLAAPFARFSLLPRPDLEALPLPSESPSQLDDIPSAAMIPARALSRSAASVVSRTQSSTSTQPICPGSCSSPDASSSSPADGPSPLAGQLRRRITEEQGQQREAQKDSIRRGPATLTKSGLRSSVTSKQLRRQAPRFVAGESPILVSSVNSAEKSTTLNGIAIRTHNSTCSCSQADIRYCKAWCVQACVSPIEYQRRASRRKLIHSPSCPLIQSPASTLLRLSVPLRVKCSCIRGLEHPREQDLKQLC